MSSVQSVTHVLGLYRSRASSPGETPAGDDYQKNLLELLSPWWGPDLDGACGETMGAIFDLLGGPAIHLGEVFDQLEAVARHAEQFFFALGHAQVGRAAAGDPREVA